MRVAIVACLAATASTMRPSVLPASTTMANSLPQRARVVAQHAYAQPSQIAAALPYPWEELVDQASGQVYYSNPSTGEATWDRPNDASPDQSGYGLGRIPVQVQELPAGWTEGFDESCSMPYYYNEQTGQTQWDPPTAGAEQADHSGYGGAQQGYGAQQAVWRVASVKGWGPRFAGKYTLPDRGSFQVALGRYDMELGRPYRPWVSREQCIVQLQADGSITLESRGKGPTLFRNHGGAWCALQKGEGLTLTHGDQISLDPNDPEGTVFMCTQEWS